MPDREKVIKHIVDCINAVDGLTNVQWVLAELDILKDTIALLKAQEGVFPHMVDWGIYECPKCKTRVDKTYKYCKCCGQGVKWE